MNKVIYLLSITLFLLACSKDENETEEITEFEITAEYYFVATIDGEKVQLEYNIDGYGNGPISGGGTNNGGYQYYDGTVFMKGLSANNSAGVIFLKTFSDSPWCNQILEMYNTGTYNYGIESLSEEENGKDGALIYYVNNDGVQWSSGFLPATQNNSSFHLLEYTDLQTFYSNKVMKAEFECTLYNSNGDSKELTNGEVKGMCVSCSN
ncbi:hypothetical protein [uncultured Draconibacterium sp.]|uniref:hypothetical protein n=1 Tax=uncultured Draconibacterium sp. TaxID=1573823 RepID=UPI002AA661D5|nr:hypothetical protein [uncultured Draconibacterium sp.]